jgi:hypothetical protein
MMSIGLLTPEETLEYLTAPCGRTMPTCAPPVGSGIICACGVVHPWTDRRTVLAQLAAFGSGTISESGGLRTRRLLLRTLEAKP